VLVWLSDNMLVSEHRAAPGWAWLLVRLAGVICWELEKYEISVFCAQPWKLPFYLLDKNVALHCVCETDLLHSGYSSKYQQFLPVNFFCLNQFILHLMHSVIFFHMM